jgi:UDP-N-acetylmuramate--alanine ligase
MFLSPQRVHFTGIGGIGMSGLAEILLQSGFPVSGSDVKLSPVTERLASLGARIVQGHAPENLGNATVLVVTSAVHASNPEVAEARRRHIPVVPRGELLAELMRPKIGIAIAGSHGKTTTTSMLATMLVVAGLDPTIVIGGRLPTIGSSARAGSSDYLVAESDESDGSFLLLSPIYEIITNIDREHLDYYSGIDHIRRSFAEFANRVPFYGAVVACLDDPNVREILPQIRRRVITYGRTATADYSVTDESAKHFGSEFTLHRHRLPVARIRVNVPGAHNVLNATGAFAMAMEIGLARDEAISGLEAYRGVDRRFQLRGEAAGVSVIDDYGHHPAEIAATLKAARACGFRKTHVLFQPHRYTRTQALMDEFVDSFTGADSVFILDIYAASEAPIEGVTGEALAWRIPGAIYAGSIENGIALAVQAAGGGDAIITQGAGSVSQAGDAILAALKERS